MVVGRLLVLRLGAVAERSPGYRRSPRCQCDGAFSGWISSAASLWASRSRYFATNAGAGGEKKLAGIREKVEGSVVSAAGKSRTARKDGDRTRKSTGEGKIDQQAKDESKEANIKEKRSKKVEETMKDGEGVKAKAKRPTKMKCNEGNESKLSGRDGDGGKVIKSKARKTRQLKVVEELETVKTIEVEEDLEQTLNLVAETGVSHRQCGEAQAMTGTSDKSLEDQGGTQETTSGTDFAIAAVSETSKAEVSIEKNLVIVPEAKNMEATAEIIEKVVNDPDTSAPSGKSQQQKATRGGAAQDEYIDVDDELKEFLMDRKLQQEQADAADEDVDDDDDSDFVWDYRDVRQLPSSVRHLEKKLKELSTTAPPDDRRIAVVKLKLAEVFCSTNEHFSPQRAVDLANQALKVLGVGADGSIEQGMCLAVLGAGYRGLEQFEKSLSYLERASRVFDEKNEQGQEVVRETQFTTNQLGLTYLSLGRIKRGVESLLEALDLQETVLACDNPELGNDFRKAAEHLCDVEQWQEAKKLCEKAIRIHGKSKGFDDVEVGEDRKIMARIYRGLNQHELALEQFRIARQIFSGDEENLYLITMGIADSQICLESYSEAIATVEGSIESIPKKPVTSRGSAYLKLAKAFYLKKDFVEGQKRLVAILDFYKENLRAGSMDEVASQLHEIAALFDAMGDVKNSIRTLKIAIAAYDCVPGAEKLVINAKMDLGSQLIRHKKPESALGYYEQAVEMSRKLGTPSSNLLTLTGIAHMELSNFQSAMEVLAEAKAMLESPEQMKRSELSKKLCFPKLSVYHNLVKCYQHFERYDDALRCQKLVVTELRIIGHEAEDKLPDATRLLEELMERTGNVAVRAQA